MEPMVNGYVTFGGFMLAVLGFAFTIFKYVQTSVVSASREVGEKVESVRREADLKIQRVEETGDKSRHSLANTIAQSLAKLEVDLRLVSRDAVRRDEMVAIEQRLTGSFAKLEGKLDGMSDRLGDLRSWEKELKANGDRLDTLVRRIEKSAT